MDIADHYGVTHIAVTPISWFPIPGTTTIRSAKLGPLLRDRLVKHEISEDVTIFEVVNSTSGHSKESL